MKSILIPTLFLFCHAVITTSAAGAFEAWQQRYSHPTDADDHLRRVACDSFGDMVAVGYTEGGPTGSDMLIIKYSGSGVIQWVRTYNGPGNSTDEGWDVAVGDDGTAYITGFSYSGSSSTSSDYATIAYSSNGEPLWTNRYNGWGGEDFPAAILVSSENNVIVTGRSASSAALNYVTIAYSAAGMPLWTNAYDGDGHNDSASAIAEGDNGRIVVTGSSWRAGSGDDYSTIAYSSGGLPLWTNRYSGPVPGADGATSLAIDDSGTVYVTGTSYGGSIAGDDYATIAYSNSGVALWTNRYGVNTGDGSQAITVYGDQIFVTGRAGNDYATISYSSSGLALWTNRYNGPGNSQDYAFEIAANTNGDIIVCGISAGGGNTRNDFTTIAYSRMGAAIWTNSHNGLPDSSDGAYGVAVDGNGNSIVVGHYYLASGQGDAVAVKYSLAGTPLWTNQFNGAANDDDWPQANAVSDVGDVFVVGSSEGRNNNTDYALIKYSSTGVAMWTNRYVGMGGSDVPRAMVTDSGRVFVTGSSWGNGTFEDYATIAYTDNGVPLWTNRYASFSSDIPRAIAVNVHGNVAVTGRAHGLDSIFTICYSPAGSTLWQKPYQAPLASDSGYDIVVTGQSNFVMTGTAVGNFVTIKYSGGGVGLWTNIYNGPATNNDAAVAVATDANGNVFVTGYSVGVGSSYDIATIAYSSSGVALWTNRYNGPANNSDFATDVAVGSNGMVFVTGYSYNNSSGTDPDYVTIAYLNSGEALWTNRYHGGVGEDIAYAVAVDKANTVIVTGRSIRTGLLNDVVTIGYSETGVTLWTNRYTSPTGGNSELQQTKSCLAIGPDGGVYVTAATDADYSTAATYDFVTVKYVAPPEILTQPASQTNNTKSTATFLVVAAGSGPLNYQWRRNGTNLFNGVNVSGANLDTLRLDDLQLTDATTYDVVVTNAFGSVTSSSANLSVVIPSPIALNSTLSSAGAFSLSFANTPGADFTALATTNLALPLSNWTVLGSVTEILTGQFQFVDSQATNWPQRFYRVRAN